MAYSKLTTVEVTIAKNGTTTDEIDLSRHLLVGIYMPDGWDAADITFTASYESDGTFIPLMDTGGNLVTLTVDSDDYISFTEAYMALINNAPFIKVVASAAQTTAARTLYLIVRGRE